MDALTPSQGIVAIAAAALALVTFVWAAVLAVKLRRLRANQQAVLGADGERDLVEQATGLEAAFVQLRDWVEETSRRLEDRMGTAEQRLDGCVAHSSLIRYDAYNEMSGQQSSSLALLDSHRTGVILTSIVHRDQARIYLKRVTEGEAEIELSPEEQEAMDTALRPAAQHAA